MSQNYGTGSSSWTEQPSFPLRATEELSIETKAMLRLALFYPTTGCQSWMQRGWSHQTLLHTVTPAASGPLHEAAPPPHYSLPPAHSGGIRSQASGSSLEHTEA